MAGARVGPVPSDSSACLLAIHGVQSPFGTYKPYEVGQVLIPPLPESHKMARLGLDPSHSAPDPLTTLCPVSTRTPAVEQL